MMSFTNDSRPHDFTHPVNQITDQTPSILLFLISNICFRVINDNKRPIKNPAEMNKIAFNGVRAQFHSITTFKLAKLHALVMHAAFCK